MWLCTLTFKEPLPDAEAYPHVQRWLKRVRRNAPSRSVRYTCVCELGGRNSRLHYHLVLYCRDDLRKRQLAHWDRGFGHYKLASAHHAAVYVSKYLSKGHGKVRSSARLGVATVEKVHAVSSAVYEAFPDARLVSVSRTKVPTELSARPHEFVPVSEIPRYEDTQPIGPDQSEARQYWQSIASVVNSQSERLQAFRKRRRLPNGVGEPPED